jgi:SET family sugar efflux transporter-like MFS transporter
VTVTSGRRLLYAPAFIGLLVTNFVLGLTTAFVAPFGSLWATQEVGMSPGMLGLFMTLNSLSAILVSTLAGRWSDSHVARRTLLLIGAGAGALGYVGYAYVHDPILLTAIGSTAIAVAALNFAQLFAHVREELGRHEGADATFLMGVLRACYSLAWAVGPNIGASIKGRFGYFGLFWTTTLFFLALLVFVLVFVAHRPHTADIRPAVTGGAAWGLGEPRVLVHCVAFGLLFAAFTLNTLNLPLFLKEKLGSSDQGVGLAFAISPVCEMLFMVGFGHLAARGHQRAVILFGASAAIGYFLALRLVSAPWQVYPLQILNASAVAVVTSVAIPYFQDLLPRRAGMATSLYSNALKAGSLVGFTTFGLLASRVGNTGLFLVCAGLGTTTLVLLTLSRPARGAAELEPRKASP